MALPLHAGRWRCRSGAEGILSRGPVVEEGELATLIRFEGMADLAEEAAHHLGVDGRVVAAAVVEEDMNFLGALDEQEDAGQPLVELLGVVEIVEAIARRRPL